MRGTKRHHVLFARNFLAWGRFPDQLKSSVGWKGFRFGVLDPGTLTRRHGVDYLILYQRPKNHAWIGLRFTDFACRTLSNGNPVGSLSAGGRIRLGTSGSIYPTATCGGCQLLALRIPLGYLSSDRFDRL